jgi:hypothetical protein
MKPVEIVQRRGRRRRMEGVNLRYIVTKYVNIQCIPLYNYSMLIKFKKKRRRRRKELSILFSSLCRLCL